MRRLSVSAIKSYEQCPQRYYYEYVARRKVEREVPQSWRFGSAVHAGLEAAFEGLRLAKTGSLRDHEKSAEAALREAWESMDLPTDGGDQDRALEVIQGVIDDQQSQVRAEDIVGVEHKMLTQTDGGVPLIGFVDLILRCGRDAVLIRDWKVTGRELTAEGLAQDFQLGTYAWMARTLLPRVKRVHVSHYYPPSQREVSVQSPTDTQLESMDRIDAVAEMITEDQAFEPTIGEHCGDCPHQDICPAWQSPNEAVEAVREF